MSLNVAAPWIPLCVTLVFTCVLLSTASAETKNATLDPSTVKMLSNILDSLDTFRDERLRDLEKLRFNGTKTSTPTNHTSTVSDNIKALRENIMGHHPVKKTFGYKVTVYTSPIEEGGKDGKPILVTQYVGGDMKPDASPDAEDDLEQSANHPQTTRIHSSESHPVSVHLQAEGEKSGGLDHSRKTEHHVELEKGHKIGHKETTKKEKGHDRETHLDKHGEHHKNTNKESHRVDEHSHDKGGASQQGIREKTEIEYYEREHFLDTEYDKAKGGHEKTSGVKEHESHQDHDTHDLKRLHSKSDSQSHASSQGQTDQLRPSRYTPPYGGHAAAVAKEAEDSRKDQKASTHLQSEESSGHKEHKSEKDHSEHQDDKGYHDKDKGRRKEGYRERGYKITAEREYFLNDAHHDTGHGFHKSGQKLRENEGEAHGSKAGERDRGFTKEQKEQESHDAAYDKKERHYEDGEKHTEGYSEAKAEHLPGVTYVDSAPLDPPVVIHHQHAYSPSATNPKVVHPATYKVNDYDDDEIIQQGYQGHATYKKHHPNPEVSKIRDVVRDAGLRNAYDDVRAAPPSYGPSQQKQPQPQQNPQIQKEIVRFPDAKDEGINPSYAAHVKLITPAPQVLRQNQPQAPPVRPYLGKPAVQNGGQVLYPLPPVLDPTAYDAVYRPRTNVQNKQQLITNFQYQQPPPRGNHPPRSGYNHQQPPQVNNQANRNVYNPTQVQQVKNPNIFVRPVGQQGAQLSTRNVYDRGVGHQAPAVRNAYLPPAPARTNDASGLRLNQPQQQQQAGKNSYSPIVLLSRGPPVDKALDVWYTNPQQ